MPRFHHTSPLDTRPHTVHIHAGDCRPALILTNRLVTPPSCCITRLPWRSAALAAWQSPTMAQHRVARDNMDDFWRRMVIEFVVCLVYRCSTWNSPRWHFSRPTSPYALVPPKSGPTNGPWTLPEQPAGISTPRGRHGARSRGRRAQPSRWVEAAAKHVRISRCNALRRHAADQAPDLSRCRGGTQMTVRQMRLCFVRIRGEPPCQPQLHPHRPTCMVLMLPCGTPSGWPRWAPSPA